MTQATREAIVTQLAAIVRIIEESIGEAGPSGLPSGHLYAALMTQGCSLELYNEIIGTLEREGRIDRVFDILRLK